MGGEQGPTDIVRQETAGTRTITATNVHLAGGPTDVVVDAQAALPEHVPVAENPLEVPANAQGLAANPLAEEVNASDAVELKLSPEKKPDS